MCQALKTFKLHDLRQFFTHFAVKFIENFAIWWKEVIFSRYFESLGPINKQYDHNFKRIDFKYKRK
jgi:hypothetical protein